MGPTVVAQKMNCSAVFALTRSRVLSNQAMPTKRPAASLPARARVKMRALSPVKPPHPCEEQEIRPRLHRADQVVYASDCSGLDGGAVALRALGVSYTHLWGSEVNPASRKVFQTMHPACKHIFEDCTARDLRLALEDLQLLKNQGDTRLVYTAGFPCQPFSKAGTRGGSSDARATVAYGVLLAVQSCQPDVFVLENVPDLVESPDYREMCLDLLQFMVRLGSGAYYIDFKIMDSYDVGQVPARRRRVYFVGVKRCSLQAPWSWPSTLPAVELSAVLEPRLPTEKRAFLSELSTTALKHLTSCKQKMEKKHPGRLFFQEPFVVDVKNSEKYGATVTYNMCPTITKSHAHGLYVTSLQDFLRPSEVLAAQGFGKADVHAASEVATSKKLYEMAGDAFTVTVVRRILESVLPAIGVQL